MVSTEIARRTSYPRCRNMGCPKDDVFLCEERFGRLQSWDPFIPFLNNPHGNLASSTSEGLGIKLGTLLTPNLLGKGSCTANTFTQKGFLQFGAIPAHCPAATPSTPNGLRSRVLGAWRIAHISSPAKLKAAYAAKPAAPFIRPTRAPVDVPATAQLCFLAASIKSSDACTHVL